MHLFLLLTKFYHVHLLTVRVYVCVWVTHTEVLPWESEENLQDLVCPSTVWIQGLNLGPRAWW